MFIIHNSTINKYIKEIYLKNKYVSLAVQYNILSKIILFLHAFEISEIFKCRTTNTVYISILRIIKN